MENRRIYFQNSKRRAKLLWKMKNHGRRFRRLVFAGKTLKLAIDCKLCKHIQTEFIVSIFSGCTILKSFWISSFFYLTHLIQLVWKRQNEKPLSVETKWNEMGKMKNEKLNKIEIEKRNKRDSVGSTTRNVKTKKRAKSTWVARRTYDNRSHFGEQEINNIIKFDWHS